MPSTVNGWNGQLTRSAADAMIDLWKMQQQQPHFPPFSILGPKSEMFAPPRCLLLIFSLSLSHPDPHLGLPQNISRFGLHRRDREKCLTPKRRISPFHFSTPENFRLFNLSFVAPAFFSLVYAVPPSSHCPLFSLFLHVWHVGSSRKPLLFSNSQSASFPFLSLFAIEAKREQIQL
jgi:hypothetical protein